MHEVDGGKTIRIILRDCACSHLDDPEFGELVVQALCEHLGMTQVGAPLTQSIPPGLSCVLIIAESHLCIHTWPESSSVRAIIDCCVDFDHDDAAEWLKKAYGAERYEYSIANGLRRRC